MIAKIGQDGCTLPTVDLSYAPIPPQAVQQIAASTDTSSELWGWSHPNLPDRNRFLSGLQDSPDQARLATLQEAGVQMPPNWQSMSLDQFLEWTANGGKVAPVQAPLIVQAHSYQNEITHREVAVTSVKIEQTGEWRQRQVTDNPGHLIAIDANFDDSNEGVWYNVTTRWQDGRCQITQVKDAGVPVEVW